MTRKIVKHIAVLFLGMFVFANSLFADMYTFEDINFVMDIPEGFEISDGTDNSLFFENKLMPVKFALKFYPEETYKNPKVMIEDVISQLSAKGGIEEVNWFGRECYLSTFQFVLPDQNLYAGWAFSIQVPLKDNPSKKQNILMLTYADAQISRDCDQYMLSIIDSIFFCQEDFRRPGPVTTFAFPKTENAEIVLNIGGKTIISNLEADAIERSKFVLEREYDVLKIYGNHEKWKEAWQRYYRQLFRESYNAFDDIARDVYKELLPSAQKANFKAPHMEMIQMLLDWVQDMEYERDRAHADFTVPVAAIQGFGCDCDSRSMLMCIMLEHFGIPTELFISREYSHAVFGAAVNQNGAAIEANGINYVLGETTAQVNFGLIAQEHSDTSKWIEVDLP